MAKQTIWTDYRPLLPDPSMLRAQLGAGYELILGAPGSHAGLEKAQIAFGQPNPQRVIELSNLCWIHVNTAGYTKYDHQNVRDALRARGAKLSSSSTVYSEPCAQHALAMLLAMVRRIPQSLENQRHKSPGWPMDHLRSQSVLLEGQKVLIVGYGSIARRLSELLLPLRPELIGVRREVRGDEPIRMVSTDQMDDLLGWADHIINVLPSSPSTFLLFNPERFKRMRRSAVFYNIGRGETVDQTALRVALETESIAAAFLDVMTPEPLPQDDPLWTTPNCYITPHTAGGHSDERDRVVRHFVENLQRFARGEELLDRVI